MDWASIMAIALGTSGSVGALWNAYINRKVAADKMDYDCQMKRIQLTYDTKLAVLETKHEQCEESQTATASKLEKCEERDKATKSDIATLKMTVAHIAEKTGVPLE
jgi:hypothetical protein